MKVKSKSEVAQSCLTLIDPHGLQPTRLLRPWDFPGKSTGVGCHRLLLKPEVKEGSKPIIENLKEQGLFPVTAHAFCLGINKSNCKLSLVQDL